MPDTSQVVPLPARRIELGFSLDGAGRLAADLREYVSDVAAEAVRRVEREVPVYARPHDPRYTRVLTYSTEFGIRHFMELLADPGAGSAEILDFCRRIGQGEAVEGRSMEPWQAAARIVAGVAMERMTELAGRYGHHANAATMAGIAGAVFAYLGRLAEAVATGHADAAARAAGNGQERRRRLIDLLVRVPAPEPQELREPALDAGWTVPRTVAGIALRERSPDTRRPVLPADILVGLHLPEPFLIVPDPEGPGRRRVVEQQLRDWAWAIGPAVAPAELALSLRLARSALDLAGQGLIDDSEPISAEMHMPIIVMMRERELVEKVIKRRLGPLFTARPQQHYRLAETLLYSVECGFNAIEVAGRLHLHAQTVRYRLRRLEELFGDSIHDPENRLELHMALRAWLTLNPDRPALRDATPARPPNPGRPHQRRKRASATPAAARTSWPADSSRRRSSGVSHPG